jgi:hypothetical protein
MGSFKAWLAALALTTGLGAAPPRPPGPPPPGPPPRLSQEQRQREIERTQALIKDLRLRLQRLGEAEAERGDDAWWDLPSRRRRQFRLRQLRFLRERLEDAQAHLIELQGPERPLEDKPISGTARP